MTSYLIGLSASAVASLLAFGLVLWYFDPATTGDIGLALFLITFFFALITVGAWLGYYFRVRRKSPNHGSSEADSDLLWLSIRQSGLTAAAATGLIALQIFRHFHWWYIPLAILLIVSVEFYIKVKVE
jgi:hypothetical protein